MTFSPPSFLGYFSLMCLRTSRGKRESTKKNLRKLKKNLNPAFSLTHNSPPYQGVWCGSIGGSGAAHYLEVRFGPSKSTCYFATAGTPSTIKRYVKSSKSNTLTPQITAPRGSLTPRLVIQEGGYQEGGSAPLWTAVNDKGDTPSASMIQVDILGCRRTPPKVGMIQCYIEREKHPLYGAPGSHPPEINRHNVIKNICFIHSFNGVRFLHIFLSDLYSIFCYLLKSYGTYRHCVYHLHFQKFDLFTNKFILQVVPLFWNLIFVILKSTKHVAFYIYTFWYASKIYPTSLQNKVPTWRSGKAFFLVSAFQGYRIYFPNRDFGFFLTDLRRSPLNYPPLSFFPQGTSTTFFWRMGTLAGCFRLLSFSVYTLILYWYTHSSAFLARLIFRGFSLHWYNLM